jgi:FAD synthetase
VHKGYPNFKRVNPIIDWNCSYVWKVIRELGLPYCKLYNEGYTSLGNKKNTNKNIDLLNEKTKTYLPAYLAIDEI